MLPGCCFFSTALDRGKDLGGGPGDEVRPASGRLGAGALEA